LRYLATSLLFYATVLLATAAQADTLNVRLILSDSSPPYQQFATAFNKSLSASKLNVFIIESQVIDDTPTDLIIAVGMKATKLAFAQTGTPTLAVMIPRTGYENLLDQVLPPKSGRPVSAIYLDQPWNRQLDFLHAALPEQRRIGLLYSADTRIDVARLRQHIAKLGGSLVAKQIAPAESLFSSLESVLDNSDVLLAVPDSSIYSSNNIRNILLTSYRYRIPLIGLSQSYVNAGALCAIFSTPEQLAEQASSTTVLFAQSGQLPGSQYSAAFSIAVNQQVARSLGIVLPPPETIRYLMDKASKEGQKQ
jgi:putative ABC transport system substrate-binding protein